MSFDATSLLISFVVSSIGFVAFMYGRKQKRLPQMVAGVALMVYPYFVSNIWIMIGIAIAILAAMIGLLRLGL
ncbi:MAG: hypothetical protein HY898_01740 [Deltaproteobacteria bacterium]|nr:hypothetical protein [Deltaproteobacteria bacterium]